ncbi:MAG: DNA polymerase III subunit delta [Succinivibrionaceae bacterium]|nr:DNA polymerase III subunit delta [Succinivibrionaceae bacterium]
MELKNIDSAQALARHLSPAKMPGLILLLGDDFYLRSSMAREVERVFLSSGEGTVARFSEAEAKWANLEDSLCSFDMFSSRKLSIVAVADQQLLKDLSTHSEDLAGCLDSDRVLLVLGPHLKVETLKTKWFAKLTSAIGNYTVQFYAPDASRLPRWLMQEAAALGLRMDVRAAALLAESYEGNLGGAIQSLNTIRLQGKTSVTQDDLAPFLSQSTRFSGFDISDAILAGDSYRSLKILHSLDQQGEYFMLLLSEVNRVLTLLLKIKQYTQLGQSTQALFQQHSVFLSIKQNQYLNTASRMPVSHLNNLIRLFALANRAAMSFDQNLTMGHLETLLSLFNRPAELDSFMSQAENPI